jgi:hypothetical protein
MAEIYTHLAECKFRDVLKMGVAAFGRKPDNSLMNSLESSGWQRKKFGGAEGPQTIHGLSRRHER